jgi:oligopeptide transport system substrate-binding protein
MPFLRVQQRNMNSRRYLGAGRGRAICALMVVVLLGGGCSQAPSDDQGPSGGDQPTRGGLIRVESQEPGSLDPPLASGSEDARIVRQLFDGLVGYNNKTAAVEPRVATRWESNEDATQWTFFLREGTKFSNGEEVTADSFVRGATRSTLPDLYNNPDGLGYHLNGVKGTAEHAAGKAQNLPGVEAVDKYTLRFTLNAADAEFVVKAGHLPFFPIPSDEAIQGQKPSWAENPIGNGPFKMKGPWQHNQTVELVRNDSYYGDKPYLDEVRFVITSDQDTSYVNWQAGNLDWTRIPPPKLQEARQQNKGNNLVRDMAGINYLAFTLKHPPLDNKLFHQAVSLAVDRKAISDAVFFGLNTPAAGIVPQLFPGSRVKGSNGPCKYCKYDPAKAKELFQQSGVKIDKLTLYFNAGAGHDEWMQAAAQQIGTNLGIQTEAVAATAQFTGSGGYTGWVKTGAPPSLDRLAWTMDYPTPDNFLYPLFFSTSADNKSNYANPEYDKLINDARKETDADARVKLYQQAEDMVLEDIPIVPMWWRTQFRLVKLDRFGGLAIDPFEDPTLRTAYVKGGGASATPTAATPSPGATAATPSPAVTTPSPAAAAVTTPSPGESAAASPSP